MKGNFKVTDSAGRTLACTLSRLELKQFSEKTSDGIYDIDGRAFRFGKFDGSSGSVLLVSADPDLLASKKLFRSRLEILHDSIESLALIADSAEERARISSRRLIHNLTSLNGHMIQDIYSVMSQDRLAGNIRRSVPLIIGEMQGKKVHEYAKCFLSLAKHSAAMKNEFSVFNKIGNLDAELKRESHAVHKVAMNVAYLFFSDFADKNSYVNVATSTLRAPLDYEFAFVALYHLFDNASKYISPGANLDVGIRAAGDSVEIEFRMLSVEILEHELDRLSEEGFSGSWPKQLKIHGSGVGLSLVDRVMQLHGGTFQVRREAGSQVLREGVPYMANSFLLRFPSAA